MMAVRSLDRRSAGDLIRLDARVRRDEETDTLRGVRTHARRIHLAVVADRPDLALASAGAIVSLADRRLRQLGGDAA